MSILDRIRGMVRGPKVVTAEAKSLGVDQYARPDQGKLLPHEDGRWPHYAQMSVGWRERHRANGPGGLVTSKPQHPSNPEYPNGVDVDLAGDHLMRCSALLPRMPGKLGVYEIRCTHCELSLALTSAGRPDDPRLVRVPCWWGRGRA